MEKEDFTFNYNKLHQVNPLGMRVLVRIVNAPENSKGGLLIPDSVKEEMSESIVAKVVEVATAVDEDTNENTNISGIPQGAYVLIEKEIGIKVPWDDKLRLVETIDVLAMIESVDLS